MTTVTPDDIRVLAQSNAADPVLLFDGTRMAVVPAADAASSRIVYSKADLVSEFGEDITDVEAETLAAGLTARLTETS